MNRLMIASMLVAGVLFSGCAVKTGNSKLEKMERTDISRMLIKGKTTQDDVVRLFGEPQSTDFMQDGRKKWVYSFLASKEKGINYVPVVSMFVRGTDDETKSLVVLFNKDNTVSDYIFSKSKGETKAGLLN